MRDRRNSANQAPLPISEKPRFDEAFYVSRSIGAKVNLLRVAQHTIML